MPRYALTIEYDGTPFVGWQFQDNGVSVQGVLEKALKNLLGQTLRVHGAGRTDTGVHATGQVAHVDLDAAWTPRKLCDALNAHLRPDPVAVIGVQPVADDFHARFSATARHYLYRFINRRAPLVLDKNRAWLVPHPLDAAKMHEAAQLLTGQHDFTTFRASQCQAKSPVKTLSWIAVDRHDDDVALRVCAPSFLHNQVRSIAGSLKLVGEGKWAKKDVQAALEAKDRRACGPVAPAHGLYLTKVDYEVGGLAK